MCFVGSTLSTNSVKPNSVKPQVIFGSFFEFDMPVLKRPYLTSVPSTTRRRMMPGILSAIPGIIYLTLSCWVYFLGLNLCAALARIGPATKGHKAVELATGNGTV